MKKGDIKVKKEKVNQGLRKGTEKE